MEPDKISNQLSNLQIGKDQDINILLLGETGVGKSTFINSLANYLLFKSYKKAAKSKLHILIPAQFTVTNKHKQQVVINVGASDDNEYQECGAAATQKVKTYVFPIGEGKTRLRLIDSPGMGDPRGVEQDNINCENILAYLAQLQELHAICFLMKPTTTRLTVFFEYCVKQILSRLEKSASRNIIFVFTNTRGSNYSGGDTLTCLKKVIDTIKSRPPHVEIPIAANVFCVDNEAFRYIAASQQDVEFNEDIKERFVESWKKSSAQCLKMISYIIGDVSNDPLKPHQLKNTVSVNEARRIIEHLSQPLAEISQLIFDNIRILERHQQNLQIENQSLDQLKKNLYIPILDLEVTQLTQPVTVCTSSKCVTTVKIKDLTKKHFGQRCHDPCYLSNVSKEIVGDPALQHCAAMSGRICQKCTCDYSVHQHIYYMTKTVDKKIEDEIVKMNINQKEAAVLEARRIMGEIDKRKLALETERDTIIKSTAQFAHFLQQNAISPFNDSYKSYIEYLIKREESLGTHGDAEVINHLNQLMNRYDEIKEAFDKTLEYNKNASMGLPLSDSPDNILSIIQTLYKLPLNGKKINELLKKQKASRKYEYDKNCEYIHPNTAELKEKSKSKEKKEKNKKSVQEAKQQTKQRSREFVPPKPPRELPPPYDAVNRVNRAQPHRQQRQYKNSNQDLPQVCMEFKVTTNAGEPRKFTKNPNFSQRNFERQPAHLRGANNSNLQAMHNFKSRECNCQDCLRDHGAYGYSNNPHHHQLQNHYPGPNAPLPGRSAQEFFSGGYLEHPNNSQSSRSDFDHSNRGPYSGPPRHATYGNQQFQNQIPPLLGPDSYHGSYNQNMGPRGPDFHDQPYREFPHNNQHNNQNMSNFTPRDGPRRDQYYRQNDNQHHNPNMRNVRDGQGRQGYHSDAGYASQTAGSGNEFKHSSRQGYASDVGRGRGRGQNRGKSLGRQPKNKQAAEKTDKKKKSSSSDSSSSSDTD